MHTDDAQHETGSVQSDVTQAAKAGASSSDASSNQPKRRGWRKVVGWTLYVLGLLGGLTNTLFIVFQGHTPSTYLAAIVVCFPSCCVGLWLVYGGAAGPSIPARATVVRTAPSSPGTTRTAQRVPSASGPEARPRLARCPLCRSTTFHVVEEAGSRRCSNCHSVLPAYIQGNE